MYSAYPSGYAHTQTVRDNILDLMNDLILIILIFAFALAYGFIIDPKLKNIKRRRIISKVSSTIKASEWSNSVESLIGYHKGYMVLLRLEDFKSYLNYFLTIGVAYEPETDLIAEMDQLVEDLENRYEHEIYCDRNLIYSNNSFSVTWKVHKQIINRIEKMIGILVENGLKPVSEKRTIEIHDKYYSSIESRTVSNKT